MRIATSNVMAKFKSDYHELNDSVRLYPIRDAENRCVGDADYVPEYIAIDEPAVLAAFVAFCSGHERTIFLRGCTRDYRQSVPSLFRTGDGEQCGGPAIAARWSAYKRFLDELRKLRHTRWRRKDVGAVLQHYGIRTPWLDVVRNLYSAIWFATHEFDTCGTVRVASQSVRRYAWISLYAPQCDQGRELEIGDLWDDQSSTHSRPHAQQGLSLAMQTDAADEPIKLQDFSKYRIAQVRFRNDQAWRLSGHMFSLRFLFAPPEQDDSLKQLSSPEIQELLDEACDVSGVERGALGSVSYYADGLD